MKSYFDTHPFAKIGLLGIPLIAFILVIESHLPKVVPVGFESFNVAFEFAKTPQQIDALFNDFTSITFANINRAYYLDFSFVAFYSIFLILLSVKTAKTYRNKWLLLVIPLSIIVFIAGCGVNVFLLKIVKIYSPSVNEAALLPLLKNLQIYSGLKWGGLALIFFVFAFRGHKVYSLPNLESWALIVPLILMIWSMTGDPMGITHFILSITIAFSLLFLRSFINPEENEEIVHATS